MSWGVIGPAAIELAELLDPRKLPVVKPPSFHEALRRIARARAVMPMIYREVLVEPLAGSLLALGAERYHEHLAQPEGAPLWTLVDALLPYAEESVRERSATAAAQELISDIYDGFLSAEDRRGFTSPELAIVPPLVAWEGRGRGPVYFSPEQLAVANVHLGLVALPIRMREAGLWAWALLAHEVAGHDVLLANRNLLPELASRIYSRLCDAGLSELAGYWADRTHEAAADILGALNIGPSLGVSLIVLLAALRQLNEGTPHLRSVDPGQSSPYPLDILRAWAVCETVGELQFSRAKVWRGWLRGIIARDARTIWIGGRLVSPARAWASARIVATEVARGRLLTLGDRSFAELQNWYDSDQRLSDHLASWLRSDDPAPPCCGEGYYAAHAITAMIQADLAAAGTPTGAALRPKLTARTIALCAAMHRENPVWRGASLILPGDR